MPGDFSELDLWVKGLERLENGLARGQEIFVANEMRYLNLAQNVGRQWMLATVPDKMEPTVWAERVDNFTNLVFSRLGAKSFEIFYNGRAEDDAPGAQNKEITYEDVLQWVEAGPENGGKDITAIESNRGRAAEQIAYDVHQAINQYRLGFPGEKDYGPITARLERWVEFGEAGELFLDRLVGLLEVWHATLEPVMQRDLSDWVDDLIAEF